MSQALNMSTSIQDSSLETNDTYTMSRLSDRGRLETWPTRTDVLCWHCCHAFETTPVGIPVDDNPKTYRLLGNFCSFNCAFAWANDDGKHHTDYVAGCRVKNMARRAYNINPEDIHTAPQRLALRAFGGTLTIEDFRKNSSIITVVSEPFVSTHMLIRSQERRTERSSEKSSASQKKKEEATQSSRREDSRFKVTGLRRPDKPMPPSKALCEQDVKQTPGLYTQFLKEKGERGSLVISSGNQCNPKKIRFNNSLEKYVKKHARTQEKSKQANGQSNNGNQR